MKNGREAIALVDVAIVLLAIVVAALTIGAPLVSDLRPDSEDSKHAAARRALALKVREIQERSFADVFRLYNGLSEDDPAGPTSGPGRLFEVPGLVGPDKGTAGRIEFPTDGVGQLRENVAQPWAGTPRDLNGDKMVDGADHSRDYCLLPIRVIIEWEAPQGARRIDQVVFLTAR